MSERERIFWALVIFAAGGMGWGFGFRAGKHVADHYYAPIVERAAHPVVKEVPPRDSVPGYVTIPRADYDRLAEEAYRKIALPDAPPKPQKGSKRDWLYYYKQGYESATSTRRHAMEAIEGEELERCVSGMIDCDRKGIITSGTQWPKPEQRVIPEGIEWQVKLEPCSSGIYTFRGLWFIECGAPQPAEKQKP